MGILPVAGRAALEVSSTGGGQGWWIDCGAGTDYRDKRGNLWVKDESFDSFNRWGYEGGSTTTFSGAVRNTILSSLYTTHRQGGTDMAYRIELPNGFYRVRLMMLETVYTEPGKRVFDVAIESVTVMSGVDLYAWRGYGAALEQIFDVDVRDHALDITFPVISAGLATIAAIEVVPASVSDDDFLDFIQKKIFSFLWEEADPSTGLVKDVENNWQSAGNNVATIASTGFALSAITIAAQRGWISEEAARERIMNTLNAFDTTLANVHGFWYHFVDMSTGARAWNCEISTVDSALFILGALQAGEHFKTTYPEIAAKAEELYRRMDWTWFTGIGDDAHKKFIAMGWYPETGKGVDSTKPEGGSFTSNWWETYCESIFVDLLALGSPTYPVSVDAWAAMSNRWNDTFGYHFIQEPPLFTHQYHNLYYDFREIFYGPINYFENAVFATRANMLTCHYDHLSRYSQNLWGLTACRGPGDIYYAYGGLPWGYHDGTVAPTAAITSIMFTPQESLGVAKHLYYQYKHLIWGRYGYCDSINTTKEYVCPVVNSLNHAPMMLAIENYRTGMIRDEMMQNSYVKNSLVKAGFSTYSQRPLVCESSYIGAGYEASKVVDNNAASRWASLDADPQWLYIDYGSTRAFNNATIAWETAYASHYSLQVSSDCCNWTEIYSTSACAGGTETVRFAPVETRYLRLYGTKRATIWGYSIWEISVADDRPPAPPPPPAGPDATFELKTVYCYPNPAQGTVKPAIHVETGIADRVEINIYTLSGEPAHSATITGDPLSVNGKYIYEYAWDTASVASGIYIYTARAFKSDERTRTATGKIAIIH